MSRRAKIVLTAAVTLVAYGTGTWFLAQAFVRGTDRWLLVGGLWVLGVIAAALVLWHSWPRRNSDGPSARTDDVDTLLRAARQRLASSRLASRRSIAKSPVVVVLGPEQSAKTTAVLRSGLDADLLAGAVADGQLVAPTPALNAWYARGTLLIEAGASVLAVPARWSRFVRHLRSGWARSTFGGKAPAARAALVCISCEELLRPGAGTAAAQPLRERIAEMARTLGARLPVYVLFTKADQIPFFADYTQNFTADEAAEVFGATLPLVADADAGLYADRESRRVRGALEALFVSLAARRPEILTREHAAERRLGAYEFPREFRKLASRATDLLVELCRPSQIEVSPFLRGFYFTGVQAVATGEAERAELAIAAPRVERRSDATSVFSSPAVAAEPTSAPLAATGRRVPRWVFLGHLFDGVLLADAAAAEVTRGGVNVRRARRALLAATLAALAVVGVGSAVSFVNNRHLVRSAAGAARAVEAAPAPGPRLASLDALRRLDSLGTIVTTLGTYARDGAPMRLRWGLYRGDALRGPLRATYFRALDRQVLGTARTSLAASLTALPDGAGAAADYGPAYDRLKAHLITTTNPDKSTTAFLSPVLLAHWSSGRPVDGERATLARRQVDRYATALPIDNPYPGAADSAGVARARAFLSGFAGDERIYQFLLSEAARAGVPAQFNRAFPGSAATVRDEYEVPAAFTKRGWSAARGAFDNIERYLGGEQWVVGTVAGPAPDPSALRASLRARYVGDYVEHWRQLVRNARVVPAAGVEDAARKLGQLSGNASPLLQLFAFVSRNTDIDLPEVARAFQPVQAVAPPADTAKLLGKSNQAYVTGLLQLQVAVDGAAKAPRGQQDAAAQPIAAAAAAAKGEARALAQQFTPDPVGKIDSIALKLLLDPITSAESLVHGLGAGDLNASGAQLCAALRPVLSKYPFAAGASVDATPQEVSDMLQPQTGALWAFVNTSLSRAVVRQGSQFVALPGAPVAVSPAFMRFLSRAAAASAALFPDGATEPRMKFTFGQATFPPEVSAVAVTLDGQVARLGRDATGEEAVRTLNWAAQAAQSAQLSAQLESATLSLQEYRGPWAAFKLFRDAEGWQPTANGGYRLAWGNRTGGQQTRLASGPLRVELELGLNGAPPVMRPDYFAGFGCVSTVAQ